jgi:hypothetical protein
MKLLSNNRLLQSAQKEQIASITFEPLIRERPFKQLKQISILSHYILSVFLLFLGYSLIGQCNYDFVTDFSNGKGFTYRTSVLIHEKCSTKNSKPGFLCDSSWTIDAIINNEKELLRDIYCKNRLLKYSKRKDTAINLQSSESDLLDRVIFELNCNQNEKILLENKKRFLLSENEFIRAAFARQLRYQNSEEIIEILNQLANDPCEYVLLEVALSLSYQGEKEVSYMLFDSIWEMNNMYINLDKFHYFTGGMRNIHSVKAIAFLKKLAQHSNMYCAMDASICLLQIKERNSGIAGIKNVLKEENYGLFVSGIRALNAYIPNQQVVDILTAYSNCENRSINEYVYCFLNKQNQ